MKKQFKVLVKNWMTKKGDNPIPMRTMVGSIKRETNKAYLMKLHGSPEPSSRCLHCNRKLTHPVSLLYGIGPICGQHFHINPFNSEEELMEHYEELKSKLSEITWEGWIPKSQIVEMVEVENENQEENIEEEEPKFDVLFKYDGKLYRTTTNSEKLYRIRQNAEIVELEQVI